MKNNDLKVSISCGGKFHAFNLAEQLDKRGYLHKLITPFYSQNRGWLPEFRKDKEQINPNKVITNIFPEIMNKGFSKIPIIRNWTEWNYYSLELFDNWAKNQIDQCDLFVGWSGYSFRSLQKAKALGAVTIIERGSSHIVFQKEILEEEYAKYGVKNKSMDSRIIEKELLEYQEADYISIPSGFVKETFINKGFDQNKLIHIPYGVDLLNFKQISKPDKTFRVIFLGSLTLRKGLHYLLQAFAELKLPDAELILIGSISPEIKQFLAQYSGSYLYVGEKPHLDLYKYLSTGSVFVLPSLEEGLAMVILQAMACGLPVICTKNTGAADIIQNGKEGFIIPIRDVNSLKEKILYLYEHEDERRFMSKMALKRAKEFTWDIYGEKITNKYKKVLEKD